MRYKLSVIIPIYNTGVFLEECVNSVINQTIKDVQIILVDDESPDNAGLLCDNIARGKNNITVIHKKNAGLGFARNSGLEKAEGQYVAFLDSDDFVETDYFEKLLYYSDQFQTDVCYSGGFIQVNNHSKSKIVFGKGIDYVMEGAEKIKKESVKMIGINPQTDDLLIGSACMGLYKLSFLRNHNITFISEREFISEDVWFNMDCYQHANTIVYANSVIGYYYRYNGDSLSRGYNANRFNQLVNASNMLLRRCKSEGYNDYYGRVAMYFWSNYKKCINQEIRYNRPNSIKNIKLMNENIISVELIDYLSSYQIGGRLETFLCRLLRNNRYYTVYLLLLLYNVSKGRKIRIIN